MLPGNVTYLRINRRCGHFLLELSEALKTLNKKEILPYHCMSYQVKGQQSTSTLSSNKPFLVTGRCSLPQITLGKRLATPDSSHGNKTQI